MSNGSSIRGRHTAEPPTELDGVPVIPLRLVAGRMSQASGLPVSPVTLRHLAWQGYVNTRRSGAEAIGNNGGVLVDHGEACRLTELAKFAAITGLALAVAFRMAKQDPDLTAALIASAIAFHAKKRNASTQR
jgi:hypothetical protein